MASLGAVVRKYRKLKKLNQAELAHAADVAPNTVARLEREEVVPQGNNAKAIIKALNIPASDLPPEFREAADVAPEPVASPSNGQHNVTIINWLMMPPDVQAEWRRMLAAKNLDEHRAIASMMRFVLAQDDLARSAIMGLVDVTPELLRFMLQRISAPSKMKLVAKPLGPRGPQP